MGEHQHQEGRRDDDVSETRNLTFPFISSVCLRFANARVVPIANDSTRLTNAANSTTTKRRRPYIVKRLLLLLVTVQGARCTDDVKVVSCDVVDDE